LISYADRLRRAGDNDRTSSNPRPHKQGTRSYTYSNYQFALPLDSLLFTFGQPSLAEKHYPIYVLLSDLYHILSIAADRRITSLNPTVYDYIISEHRKPLPYVSNQDPIKTDHISNPDTATLDIVAPLRLSTFILTSYLLSGHDEYQTQSTAQLVSHLRSLLNSRNHTNWVPFQGALVWCLAIGLRFANPQRDRTWFLMQFMRVSHRCVLEMWYETSRSLEVLVPSLERIRRASVEAHDSTV